MPRERLLPKLFTTLETYSFQQFYSDLTAGVIVGIVALPLAIAFAIASGVSPDKGLITAIVAGFLISTFGGSRVQIGGPTGAFVVIVYGIVHQYGEQGLIMATFLAGILLILMGFARFGSMIKFIPHPVIVGFTSGIALIIFSSQIRDFFGLEISSLPADFLEKWVVYGHHYSSFNPYALMIGSLCLLIMIFWPRFSDKVPGSLIALLLATVIIQIFHWPVETIGSRFGQIPSQLPPPVLPFLDFSTLKLLVKPATTIAFLAAVESLLSAVVADGMIGGRHRSNMELIAQGVANVGSSLFGGMPATGAIARTATNIKNGGRTPVAGIIHALVLLLIMIFFGKWAKLIPLSALAAILIMVSYNMSEWRSFATVLKSPRSDILVLLTTFTLTVVLDLTLAIEVGMVLAAFLFMRRMALVTNIEVITREFEEEDIEHGIPHEIKVPEGVQLYEIKGPFFFGAAEKFSEAMNIVSKPPKVRIISMEHVPAIDSTGLHVLEKAWHQAIKKGCLLLLVGVQKQPRMAMIQSDLMQKIGPQNICDTVDQALQRAQEKIRGFVSL